MAAPVEEKSRNDPGERPNRAADADAPQALPDRLRRLIPSTALGLAALIFCMGVASAFSGAVLYAYYESRQEATTNKVESFVGSFTEQLDNARKIVKDEGQQAKEQVQNQLDELQKFAASGTTLTQLAANAQPSVFFVSTLDGAGAPSVGSAFVVFSDAETSYLLTSFTTVAAGTQQPAPGIVLRKPGGDDMDATLYAWDPGKDLALLTVGRPNLPALAWADGEPKVGDRVFAISGLGSTGVAITQGFVADVSAQGVQHDAPIGTQFQGGPLLSSDGRVVGITSRAYAPLGFRPDSVWFAPLVRQSCDSVLRCPDGAASAPAPGDVTPTTTG
ncbi:MAG: trypsin-like peptidase domain-containing protein [Acidimicrobiales bacterium]